MSAPAVVKKEPIKKPQKSPTDIVEKATLEVLINGQWLVWSEVHRTRQERWDNMVLTNIKPIVRVQMHKLRD